MPAEYFADTIRPQLCSLLEETALKDTAIMFQLDRSLDLNSFVLSLLSPVLRKMLCGNFRESMCRKMSLDDVDAECFSKLIRLACGGQDIAEGTVEDLVDLCELAERLQMEAVTAMLEDMLSNELTVENCAEMSDRGGTSGLKRLQKKCYSILRDEFEVIRRKEGFLKLSEETMGDLLEEDELGVSREEDVFEAVLRWMTASEEGLRGEGLLRKIRYGVIGDDYLAGTVSTTGLLKLKELLGEAMAKKGRGGGEGMWEGMERLSGKWMVARKKKAKNIGTDVLKSATYVAMDGKGCIVVSDSELHEVIVFESSGSVARRFGSHGASVGQFNVPMGIAVDRHGHIVVADLGNHRIQVLNEDGSVVRCFGSKGSKVGHLNHPCGVAIDREDRIMVAEYGNHRVQVFNVDGSVVRHFGSKGGAVGQLNCPTGVAVNRAGCVVVADTGNHRVQVFNGDGSVALCFGSQGQGPGQLKCPLGVAVDSMGRLIVADTNNHRIQVYNSDGSVSRIIGGVGGAMENIRIPMGVMIDGAGRIVVAESKGWSQGRFAGVNNHQVQVL